MKSKPYRELMVSVWYPARGSSNLPLAPQMSPLAAANWDKTSAPPLGIESGAVDWAGTLAHARVGAPVKRGEHPVIVFASGDGGVRTLGTALVEELAARGYIVVTVDRTYEADQVEFPGGRVERAVPLPENLTEEVIADLLIKHSEARVADMKSTGWKRAVAFTGAKHGSFSDLQTWFPQIAAKLPKVPEAFPELIGTIDPDRSIAAQRAYVAAFFDLHLKGQRTRLFDGPAKRFPEVKLIP